MACKATGWGVNYSAEVWRFGTWWFFSWRGSSKACRSALGGEGVDGHRYWWPCGLSRISGFGGFFSKKKEKNLGEQKFARLSVSNFCNRMNCGFLYNFKVVNFQIGHHSNFNIKFFICWNWTVACTINICDRNFDHKLWFSLERNLRS